jgi:arsenate reductase (thioredoxin)
MSESTTGRRPKLGFVCVQNAGRSQISAAFAEREAAKRGLDVEILTGGTLPAAHVHPEVVETMDEVGIDLSEEVPREVTDEQLAACDVVATMGCSTLELDTDVDVRDWDLDDPDGKSEAEVRAIRDEIEGRVGALFDELEAEVARTQ